MQSSFLLGSATWETRSKMEKQCFVYRKVITVDQMEESNLDMESSIPHTIK